MSKHPSQEEAWDPEDDTDDVPEEAARIDGAERVHAALREHGKGGK